MVAHPTTTSPQPTLKESIMAKSHYSGDSPFPSPSSEPPRISGGSETFPVKPAPFPALPAIAAPFMPPPCVLKDGAAMYIGGPGTSGTRSPGGAGR